MENLILKQKGQLISKKGLGVFWLILGIIALAAAKGPLEQKDWLRAITFWVIGIIHFTPLIGSSFLKIEIGDGKLTILWLNWIRKVTIQESEIEGITIAQKGISIKRKGMKPVKLLFFVLDRDQIKKVQDFFTEYSKEKNFIF
jgi:hypothetical protein